jgi:ribokinase
VDVLSPNQSEAALLTGRTVDDADGAEAAGRWLLERGAGMAVVKRGRAGATIVAADGEVRHVNPIKVEAVDTTAAGDAFTAALAVALAEGASREAAGRFAAAAGALAVTKFGAQPAMPTREEVERLAAESG